MKKSLLFIACLLTTNLIFAQVTDSVKTKKTVKTTTTTTTTIVTAEPIDSIKKVKNIKKVENIATSTDKKNVIKTNITSLFISTFHLSYERAINQKVTFQLSGYYTFLNNSRIFTFQFDSGRYEIRGFGITPEVRFYPNGNRLEGFFLALSPRFQYNVERKVYDQSGSQPGFIQSEVRSAGIGAGLIVGQQWLIAESVSLELYAGPSVNGILSKETIGNPNAILDSPYPRPIGFRFGFNVGIAF